MLPRVAERPEITRAVFDDTRLAILAFCGEPQTLAQVREGLGLTRSAARHHVDVLVRAGLLRSAPRGYRSDPGWSDFRSLLEGLAGR
jgi:DNA-binding transcriptional ArsR family regulator